MRKGSRSWVLLSLAILLLKFGLAIGALKRVEKQSGQLEGGN